MATGISIGPRIGIEGAAEFQRQIRTLASEFKMFEAEIKKASATFEKNGDLLALNETKTKNLKQQMNSLNQVIANQSLQMDQLKKEWGDQSKWTDTQQQQYNNLNTALSKNIAKYTELEVELDKVAKETQDYNEMSKLLSATLEAQPTKIEKMAQSFKDLGAQLSLLGGALTLALTVPLTRFFKSTVQEASNWETGFTGVKKTTDEIVDANGNLVYSYEDLEKSLRDTAKNMVLPYDELLKTAEISGQLGIAADNLTDFSKVMMMLGTTTNLTSEEAAMNIAKILNITNKGVPPSIDMVEKFGNVIVALGNNFATTEADITLMATRLASAASIAGLSEHEILALSTAMSSMGIRAEAGGSAMAQVLVNLEKRVAHFRGGSTKDLETVSKLAGMTADDFADAWENRPIEAISAFLEGISKLDEEAQSTSLTLEELDMDGIRQSNMIKALSEGYPLLADAIKMANEEWQDGTALFDEYGKYEDTYAARAENLRNNWRLLKDDIGRLLLPVLEDLIEVAKKIIDWLEKMPDGVQEAIVGFGLFAAAVGPVLTLVGGVSTGIGSILDLMSKLGKGGAVSTAAAGMDELATGMSAAAKEVDGVTKALGTGGTAGSAGTGLLGALGLTGVQFVAGVVTPILAGFAIVKNAFDENGKVTEEWEQHAKEIYDMYQGDFDTWGQQMITGYDEYGNALTQSATEIANNQIAEYQRAKQSVEEVTKQKKIMVAATEDALGNQLRVINERTSKEVVAENQKRFEVINTAVKGYKTSTIADFEETEKGMINAIETHRPLVTSAMQTTADEAKKPITSLIGQAWQWGKDLISGFVSGITSSQGSVASAAVGVARLAKGPLHFSKPDYGPLRDYEQWMPHFVQGLADGINSNAWRVEDAINSLSADMAIGVTGTTKPLANQNSFNYGGVVINLNVPEGTNGQMLVDEIEQELSNRVLRRKAVFG